MESGGERKPRSGKPSEAGKTPRKPPPSAEESKRKRVLAIRIAIVAVAALAVVLGVLIAGGDDDEQAAEGPAQESSRIVSAAELRSIAAAKPTPIFWAGEQPGTEIELTEEPGGSVYVRYLEEGTEVGEGNASSLTIGSYPQEDPEGELRKVAAGPDAFSRKAEDGRQVVGSEGNPYSVYFASPDNTVQVEVYDPSPDRALDRALSDEVQPVG